MEATLSKPPTYYVGQPGIAAKVLVVDDQAINRAQLSELLQTNGFIPLEASSGSEALKILSKTAGINMVLMDVVMPGMDGLETTRQIKTLPGLGHLPVIFVTSAAESDLLEACYSAGGDDFIRRPIIPAVLLSRLRAHLRLCSLHNDLKQNNKELARYKKNLASELQVVEHVFNNVIKPRMVQCPSIDVHLSPMSMFNGDLYLAYRTETGSTYIFIGDFTGHGLPAAIGCMPVADLFYAMAAKYATVGEIAAEANRKLNKVLPYHMFCCAAIMELSPTMNRIKIWCGGMHDILIVDEKGQSNDVIRSQHMPLGILPEQEFDSGVQEKSLLEKVRLFAYTDGVIEAQNPFGEMFGERRLNSAVIGKQASLIHSVLSSLDTFKMGCEQKDDITLLEINTALAPLIMQERDNKVDEMSKRYLPMVINPHLSMQLGSQPRQLQLRLVPANLWGAPGMFELDQQVTSFEGDHQLPILLVYRLVKTLLETVKLTQLHTSNASDISLAEYDHEACIHMERVEGNEKVKVSVEILLLDTETSEVNELDNPYLWTFSQSCYVDPEQTIIWNKAEIHSHGRALRLDISRL